MAKLTKLQARNHNAAMELLKKDVLTDQEKEFVFINYHPGANSINGQAGAFFTPLSMAFDAAYEAGGDCSDTRTFIDLCAGIGVLSYALVKRYPKAGRIVCVEINPEYVELGKKLVPEAEWYCLDVMDIEAIKELGVFDDAISNPPYGKVPSFKGKAAPRYTGGEAEYKVIDVAGLIADSGTFIVPQQSSGFRYSGAQYYERQETPKYKRFVESSGIELDAGMGHDTSAEGMYLWDYDDGTAVSCNWIGVKPVVEFATCHYPEVGVQEAEEVDSCQFDLFLAA